ncbi:MAG: alpha/beta fold hydrolase [Ktedonobacterales bacterium]|nr:alpha/beta fold hydrolase [Ktedonobacterales bacterium]
MLQVQTRNRTHRSPPVASSAPALAYIGRGAGADGPVVVGLHGLASAARSLAASVLPLADDGARVYLPDLLGHGASPYPAGDPYDIESHVAALGQWADATVGHEPLWLVGYSLGAQLALAWAAREPERVRGVVAISAPLFLDGADARRTLARGDLMAWLMLRAPALGWALTRLTCGSDGLGVRLSAVRSFQRLYIWALVHGYGPRPAPGGEALASRADVEKGLLCGMELCWLHSWEAVYRSLLRCIVDYSSWPDLARARMNKLPVIFIHGDQDTIAPVTRARLAAAVGPWPIIEYAGAAHSLALTHAHALNRELARHLAEMRART